MNTKSFCINCVIKECINSSNDLIQSLQIIDNHLQRIGKWRISVKRDGHGLPRALFSGLKRKHALKDLNTYKELIRLCIRELINDNEDLYSPWLSDSIESVQTQLEQYQKNKKYHSNIMNVFASALPNVCSATIPIYYPCEKDVNTHTIVPKKGKILTYVEVSFVSGHYDLIVDRLNMKEKGPIKEALPEVILIDDSPVKQNPDDKKHDIKCESEKEKTFSNQNSNETIIMEIRIEDSECSLLLQRIVPVSL